MAAPVKHGKVIQPQIIRIIQLNTMVPTIELWFGDPLQFPNYPQGEPVSHFIVTSANPRLTFLGTAGLNHKLGAPPGVPYAPPADATDFRPSIDGAIVDVNSTFPQQFEYLLFYDPQWDVLTTRQAAPYRTDAIFRAVQAYSGRILNAVTIPLTVDPQKIDDAVIMLQSLVHSAIKYATWKDCILGTIRIVIDSQYKQLVAAFDRLADIEAALQDPKSPVIANLPTAPINSSSFPYSYFATETNTWIAQQYPKDIFPDSVTYRQVFGIFVYTTEYFHPLNDALIKPDPNLPVGSDKVGFTDLTNTDYQDLIPLYASISAGLMNIRAFHGTTYRGSDDMIWNPFAAGTTVRYLNYVSSALQYPEPGKLPWPSKKTSPPWNNTSHMRLQSQSARDIAPYSKHGYETEHLFDHGVVFYITSNMPPSKAHTDTIIIGNEVPATMMPLL